MPSKNLKFSVVSYFFIAFVLDGLQRQSGIFIKEILQSMNVSRQTAAIPFSVSWAIVNIMASFSDVLTQNEKSNYIILSGVMLTAAGAALCLLISSVTTLTICWGLIFGVGYGLASPQLLKHLKNANSCKETSLLLQATPNVGTIIMPFITYAVITCYGLQGSYLIFSGIILNYLPLFLASVYKIELRIPDIKWKMAKRSSHYFVSKQNVNKIASNESFINSLEPDLILKISQSEGNEDEIKSDTENSEINAEVFQMSRKRSDTKGSDLLSITMDPRAIPHNRTQSEILTEIQTYEKGRRVFEGSFNNYSFCDNNDLQINSLRSNESRVTISSDNSNKCVKEKPQTTLENKILLTNTENYTQQTNECKNNSVNTEDERSDIINKSPISEDHALLASEHKDGSISKYSEDEKGMANTIICQNNILPKSKMLGEYQKQHESPNCVNGELNKESENTHNRTSSTTVEDDESPIKNSKGKNALAKNLKLSAQYLNETATNIPIEIKVYVEECTFMTVTGEENFLDSINIQNTKSKKTSYRNHSNSMLPGTYDNIDFTLTFPKKFPKSSDFNKPKLSQVYSISENAESCGYTTSFETNNIKQSGANYTISNIKRVLKYLNEITMPVCLCIIFITIIFEFNLVTLIAIFADYGEDIDKSFSGFRWILVSFGIGGILGKFCCCKISKTIPEKSHGLGVILFLLKGLSVAGVLFSSSMAWLAVFYCILGALEGGITYTIPKLISEHIDKDIHSKLTAARKLFSGIAVMSVPYMIGFSRDELGDYEFLLQTLSCSCVFCAFLVYFVPRLSKTNNHILK